MTLFKRFSFFALALFVTAALGAVEPSSGAGTPEGRLSFKAYGIEQGLMDPAIYCLAEDHQGFVWCGTANGLVRFSGGQLHVFGTREGLPGPVVHCVCESSDGILWAGTTRGLACWKNDRFWSAAEEKGLPAVRVDALAVGSEGQVWLGTPQGVYMRNGPTSFVLDPAWPGGQVSTLCPSPDGKGVYASQWVGGRAQVLVWKQGVWKVLESAPSMGREIIESLAVDQKQILWVRSLSGLWCYRQDRFQEGPRVGRARQTSSLHVDPKGRVWTNTEAGLSWTDGRQVHSITTREGFPEPITNYMLIDREGSLWVAGEGVFRLRGGGVWRTYGKAQGLPDQTIWCIFKDRDGARWVGTDRGIARMTPQGFQVVPGTESTQVRSITQGPDGLLYMTGSPYVISFDPRNGRIQKLRTDQGFNVSRRVYRLKFDQNGELWAATETPGLFHAVSEKGIWRFHQEIIAPPHPEEPVQDVTIDSAGRVWASGQLGLAMREGGVWRRFTTQDGLRTNDIAHVAILSDGDILGAYFAGKGIFKARFKDGRFQILEHFDNLVTGDQTVYLIGEDAKRNLWVGTGQGLDLITPERKAIHFSTADGLAGDDINSMAFLAEPDGDVWIGTALGLARFDASSFSGIPAPPRSVIHSYLLGQHQYFSVSDKPLRVPRASSLEVHFSCPSFVRESSLQKQVRLLGQEAEWHDASGWSERFSVIPPGQYTFEVRSRILGGEWGAPARLSFVVLPAWWQTWWAIVLYIGFGASAITGVFHVRTRILRQRNVILQARIEEATFELKERERLLAAQAGNLQLLNEQKNQFLGIVAHDLRNPLSGIVLAAQLLEDETDLDFIRQTVRKIYREGMDMSSLIGRFLDIAAIDSGKIKAESDWFDLTGLVRHVANRHAARAQEKGIALEFAFPELAIKAWADAKFTKEVLDNLISNAVKFSPLGTVVTLRVEDKGNCLCISVEDQGPGLTEEDQQKLFGRFARLSAQPTGGEKSVGLGLSIVKHLVDAMKGRIWVESEPGKGAAFRVELPCNP